VLALWLGNIMALVNQAKANRRFPIASHRLNLVLSFGYRIVKSIIRF
jgi:hypothetical protein